MAQRLDHLISDHEEADTRMMLHAQDSAFQHQRLVIQTPDTDVVVLAIYVSALLQSEQLWVRMGVRDKLRFIPIHRIVEKLGPDLCSLLPAFHALTGCDTTSGPYLIGKKRSWTMLQENQNKYAALMELGDTSPIQREVLTASEKYLCSLYYSAEKARTTADDVR
jgi:hypothetical protein